MLKFVLEDYLSSINELEFFLPFKCLLESTGHFDIHIIHGSLEFGKDIISKKMENSHVIQYYFQIKQGDINLTKFNNEVKPQLLEAYTNKISHPNFDRDSKVNVIFVTTGKLLQYSRIEFQEFNNFLTTHMKMPAVESWEHDKLVQDFTNYTIEPFYFNRHNPKLIGEFFSLYAKIKNNKPIESFEIESFTRRWLEIDFNNNVYKFYSIFEAFILIKLLNKNNRYYDSISIICGLTRALAYHEVVDKYYPYLEEYLFDIISASQNEIFEYLKHNDDLMTFTNSFFLIFEYPISCFKILEMLALKIILSDNVPQETIDLFYKILDTEKGVNYIISDNYSISIVLTSISLFKLKSYNRLRTYLTNLTVFLCDRYDQNGIAPFGADRSEEYEQILSEYLTGFKFTTRNSCFCATAILDMCLLLEDDKLYINIANDFRASKIILEYVYILDNSSVFTYDNQDILSAFEHDYSLEYKEDYSIFKKYEKENLKVTFSDKWILYIIFLLRDRYFPEIITKIFNI